MAIRQKVNSEGKTTYEVSINLRSKIYPDLRVQRMKTLIKTLKEAQSIERNLLRECAGELARKEGSETTWADLLEQWELAHRFQRTNTAADVQPDTIREMAAFLHRWTQSWMKRECHEIRPGDVRQVIQTLEDQDYSHSRKRAFRTAVNVVFKWGISEGKIRSIHHSPAFGLELKKTRDEKPPLILSLAEIHKLLESAKAMDHEWYYVWAMALNTGMRSGELFSLEWNDIDWDNKLITVSKSYNGRLKTVKSTKAGYWRKVPFNSDTEEILKELRVRAQGNHVLPRLNKWKRGEAAKVLREFCEGIGINSVSFHALRACFATHLLNAGVTSPVVKKICGWTEEKVMNRYIRLAGIDVAGATEGLGFIRQVDTSKQVVNLHAYRPGRGTKNNE